MTTLLNNLTTSLSTTGNTTLLPLLSSFSKALPSFNTSHLFPFLAGAVISLDNLRKDSLIPAAVEVGRFSKEKLGPQIVEGGGYMIENIREKTGPMVKRTGGFIKEKPWTTVVFAISGVVIAVPGLVSGSMLWVCGWGSLGVRGGSAAAAIQASGGPVIAGSGFATLQSAGMGGYGAPTVNSIVQGCSAAVGGIVGILELGNRTTT